ncbi:FTR1 family protein [Fusobacterium massiliense]|jgi:ofeT family oxidase-dependent iron (fe2+) transporter|uniref:FTR1 family iron permease n=1 Tax=Fusobacterium massiliense TaxID=1852365 RepID=UPI0036F37E38
MSFVFGVIFSLLVSFSSLNVEAAQKKKYDTWQDVAKDMNVEFQAAKKAIETGNNDEAYDAMNRAYFGYYEVQGFEKNVMVNIAAKRVNEIEATFRRIKHVLKGNLQGNVKELDDEIDLLAVKVYRDAMVLDGAVAKDSPDSVGEILFKGGSVVTGDETTIKLKSFGASFGLLLREGLEAILVVVAIIAYLVKTGNEKLCKQVYYGMGAGVIGSFILAFLIDILLGGVGQEMMEGITMFLAVAVLFWVSNWILSRSEEEAWSRYIKSQVQKSIDQNSGRALIFSAFLAVLREGAELVLFYKAMLTGGQTNKMFAFYGFLVGTVVLIAIYVIFRYTTVRLPLKPFFKFTSILLFLLCISFMGKGVVELTEAGVISGSTTIPAMNGYQNTWLNIYDRAETLIPQIMLVIASCWMLLNNSLKEKKAKKEAENN